MSLITGERLFPVPTTIAAQFRQTVVMWVIKDEEIPTVDEFWSTYENIEPCLQEEGIRGIPNFEVHIVDPNKEPSEADLDPYFHTPILINCDPGDNEDDRFDRIVLNILLLALGPDPYNFVIISKNKDFVLNKDFGQGTNFSSVCDSLREMGVQIAVAHPDHFKDFDRRISQTEVAPF
ncbi:PREDICTED: uncharacterized protein LOC104718123 [Camelina sativa]|uniref:Uncharacterized protein LOC104718123 n=1 Tax=Camelina sativa TaxID=90675 RepID=A0ABM0U0K7_CAMSA|nr:PREDICTED: uncharacterized protein LOC104718123 [Camelina sativa]